MLEETKKGVPGMLQWSADRANFGCCPKVVLPLLRGSQQSHLLDKLEMMPLRQTPIPMTCRDPWFLDEIALLKLVRVFYTNLGINMLWMEAQYAICFPHKLAIMNHQEPEQVKNGCAYMKKLADAIGTAEALVKANPKDREDLKNILETCYYLDERFAREVIIEGNNEKWDPDSQNLKDSAQEMSGGSPTTVDACERAFAHLAGIAKQQQNNKRMAEATKWYYLSTSPYAAAGGMPQIAPSLEDYRAAAPIMGDLYKEVNKALSNPKVKLS